MNNKFQIQQETQKQRKLYIDSRLLVAMLIGAVTISLTSCNFGRVAASPPPVVLPNSSDVSTAAQAVIPSYLTVERGEVVKEASFVGRVAFSVQEDLFFASTGRVARLFTDSGSEVAEGDVIASLDATELTFDLEAAELAMELANQRIAEAEERLTEAVQDAEYELQVANLQREEAYLAVSSERLVYELRVKQAELALERLQRGIDPTLKTNQRLAELALRRARAAFEKAQIVAPFDGEVRFFELLEEGRVVPAYESVATLVDPTSMQIEANLVRAELEQLYEELPVSIQLVNAPNITLTGQIERLPQPFGSGRGPAVQIGMSNGDQTDNDGQAYLRVGSSVNVSAEVQRVPDALWLPPSAIRGFRDNYFVVVRNELTGQQEEVQIKVGVQGDERFEITEGLAEGDQVVDKP